MAVDVDSLSSAPRVYLSASSRVESALSLMVESVPVAVLAVLILVSEVGTNNQPLISFP